MKQVNGKSSDFNEKEGKYLLFFHHLNQEVEDLIDIGKITMDHDEKNLKLFLEKLFVGSVTGNMKEQHIQRVLNIDNEGNKDQNISILPCLMKITERYMSKLKGKDEVKNLKERIDELEFKELENISKLEILDELELKIAQLESMNQELKQQLNDKERELNTNRNFEHAFSERYTRLLFKNTKLLEELNEKEEKNLMLEMELNRIKQENKERIKPNMENYANQEETYQSNIQELQDAMRSMSSQLFECEETIEIQRNENIQLHQKLNLAKQEIILLEKEIESDTKFGKMHISSTHECSNCNIKDNQVKTMERKHENEISKLGERIKKLDKDKEKLEEFVKRALYSQRIEYEDVLRESGISI